MYSLALSASCLFIPVGLLFVAWRMATHPLRHYPGPFIARFTDAYAGYHALFRRVHLMTHRDHNKYGSVYRQGPNRLVFNSVTAVEDIYLNPNINKADHYKVVNPPPMPHTSVFGTLGREEHRHKRKVYGQILSDRSVRAFEPTLMEEINIFLQCLLATDSPVNLSALSKYLTLDVAGHVVWGDSVKTQTRPENRPIVGGMAGFHAIVNFYLAWPVFSKTFSFLLLFNKHNADAIDAPLKKIATDRMALPKDAKHDFYSVVGDDMGADGDYLQHSALWTEAFFLLSAAHVTTSAAISAIFFYLSRSPAAYRWLAAEVRSMFSSGRDINSSSLSECKYLRAVIDESLRLSPPFPGTFWREPYPSHVEPFIVDGHVIPPGTAVGVNPYSLMHNAEYFPRPYDFLPERWLDDNIPEAATARPNMRRAFLPFAIGDRSCIGKSMAYSEIALVIAKTLWYFDFEKPAGSIGKVGEGWPGHKNGRHRTQEFQIYDIAGADHDGPYLKFKPRGDYYKDLK